MTQYTPSRESYAALVAWELGGDWPDQEMFSCMVIDQIELRKLADRYRKLIDAWESSEHTRPTERISRDELDSSIEG